MSEAAQPAFAPAAWSAAAPATVRVGTARADDGAELRWRVLGDGPGTPLLCSNGIGVGSFFWHFLGAQFGPERPVLTWDYRGHGASPVPRDPGGVTVVRCAKDLWSVADAAGIRRAVLVGHSMGCQTSLEAIRLQPARAAAFIPMLGAPGLTLTSFPGGGQVRPVLRAAIEQIARRPALAESILRAALSFPGLFSAVRLLGLVHPELCPPGEFEPYFAHLRTLDLRCYFSLLADLLTHDASDLLPHLAIPALVLAGSRDLFTPLSRSEEMAEAIPRAELLVIRDGSHAALVEQPELIQLAVERFLRRNGL